MMIVVGRRINVDGGDDASDADFVAIQRETLISLLRVIGVTSLCP